MSFIFSIICIFIANANAEGCTLTNETFALNITDSGGDNCTWYGENMSQKRQCGWWDTKNNNSELNFTAHEMCCECANPFPPASDCQDSPDKKDVAGDTCDWYKVNWNSCGDWDSADFSAATDCCACFNGFETCEETLTTKDSGDDTCAWYWSNTEDCGRWDDEDFDSSQCCACQ